MCIRDSAYTSCFMQAPVTVHEPHDPAAPTAWWRQWWWRQTPVHQDRFAMLAPVAAVLLFLAAIVSAFGELIGLWPNTTSP